MIQEYIREAMRHAAYKMLEDDHSFFGEIPECQGVWANAPSLEACREELEEVLEDWLLIRLRKDMSIPAMKGITLDVHEVV
ncbi:MAG TPA: type II toxin-antitoxin system HicB family antitoxin [Candidatus Kapabacteria bacterium]|jgi:predicted RNase H-like HicB family nuclease